MLICLQKGKEKKGRMKMRSQIISMLILFFPVCQLLLAVVEVSLLLMVLQLLFQISQWLYIFSKNRSVQLFTFTNLISQRHLYILPALKLLQNGKYTVPAQVHIFFCLQSMQDKSSLARWNFFSLPFCQCSLPAYTLFQASKAFNPF